MKLMTIFGTRPEIIRLSVIIKQLDRFCEQKLVHTGQNYDERLSDVFFRELELRPPDVYLGVRAEGFGEQVGQILQRIEQVMADRCPDRILILGDTNSALSSMVAARRAIPVFHLEAGNRCYDDRVPEEINRRLVDHCSTILMAYTHRGKENLLREGIERNRIFVIGNPIYEVIQTYEEKILHSDILERLELKPHRYFVATLHRAENVDSPARLPRLLRGLESVAEKYGLPVVVSLHPRTADGMQRHGLAVQCKQVVLLKPLGFIDFVALERNALCVITDSGTVQEECCIFQIPNVTIRDVTERPETIECGSNVLGGADPEMIVKSVDIALETLRVWTPPVEYIERNVSTAVTKIVLGYTDFSRKPHALAKSGTQCDD